MAARESDLLPIYHQVAVAFADLHDTPGRMLAKGVVSAVLQWRSARRVLARRLRRRIAESEAVERLQVCHVLTRL